MRRAIILVEFAALSVAAFLWLGARDNQFLPSSFLDHPVVEEVITEAAYADDFDWSKLSPSTKLNWADCYPSFQCARFIVPLNYSEPAGESAVIALIRKPATDTEDYRGPILFNPGGPGGSGVDLVRGRAEQFLQILGPKFDLVGFDPRGIGRTTPKATLFEDQIESRLWEANAVKATSDSFEDFTRLWSRSQVMGKLAEQRNLLGISHLRTENVAQDMLRITEAHGFEKLQYWGFSYGTILGATFASLFPDKVGRVLIDGVADAEDYYAATWANGIRDTDKSVQTFFDQCSASSPSECAFWSSTPGEIETRLDNLYESLRERPVPVTTQSEYGYDIVDYSVLRSAVFSSLYRPYPMFRTLAEALKDLEAGNGTKILEMVKVAQKIECKCDQGTPKPKGPDMSYVSAAIYCGDGKETKESPEDLYDRYLEMYEDYGSFADVWIGISAACAGWRIHAPERFLGPFTGNTSFPLLVIGNTADPVTPLWSAFNVASGFPSSVVLTQNSGGHCSISSPSVCTSKHIRSYFVDGKLPEKDTVCEVSEPVFKPSSGSFGDVDGSIVPLSADEGRLLETLRQLSRDPGVGSFHRI